MRRLMHHLLLLALLFHTAVGVPLHAAQHLHVPAPLAPAQHTHAHGLQHIEDFDAGTALHAGCAHEHHGEEHAAHSGSCVWCQQLAQLALALPSAALAAPAAAALELPALQRGGWLPRPPARHGRHAARAPPAVS